MNQAKPMIRVYVPGDFLPGQILDLNPDQSHYLTNVMRLNDGDALAVFNEHSGEWEARVARSHKKHASLSLVSQRAKPRQSPDVWLVFAALKNKSDLVVEKATELGVSKIFVVPTAHSVAKSVNMEKLVAHATEAAEQCERHDVPSIETAKDLPTLLGVWPKDRVLFYGDESGGGENLSVILSEASAKSKDLDPSNSVGMTKKYAMLIGPEGGFSALEHQALKAAPFVKAFGMGPRILRADTAAVAALACLMMQVGDWQEKPKFGESAA